VTIGNFEIARSLERRGVSPATQFLRRHVIPLSFVAVAGGLMVSNTLLQPTFVSEEQLLLARAVFVGIAGAVAIFMEHRMDARRAGQEAAVRTSAERFRQLAEHSRDVVYRIRLWPDRVYEYVSPSVTALTGYTPEEHYADPELGLRYVHPDDRHLLEEADSGSRSPEEPLLIRWIRRDGSLMWTELRGWLVRDATGRPIAAEGASRDVTKNVLAAEALAASERRFRSMLENIDVPASAVDTDGRITSANRAFLELLGWTADELLGRDWHDTIVAADERERLRDIFHERVAAGLPASTYVMDMLTRSGEVRAVSWTTTPIKDADGRIVGSAAMGHDLTAARRAAELHSRLAAAVEQTAESVMICDPRHTIVYVNPAFERVSGYSEAEVLGRHARFLSAREQSDALFAQLDARLAAGLPWSGELVNRRKDGTRFLEEASITPVFDADGKVSTYVTVKRDVTHLRAIEASLEEASRERAETARILAGIEAGLSTDETAQSICDALVTLPGVDFAALAALEGPNDLVIVRGAGLPIPDGFRLPTHQAIRLRERALAGPWSESWHSESDADAFDAMVTDAGVTGFAASPIGNGHGPVGILFIGTVSSEHLEHLVDRLPTLVEFAATTNGLIGRALSERRDEVAGRRRLQEVIDTMAFHSVFQPVVDLTTGRPIGFEALTRFEDGTPPDEVFASAWRTGLGPELERATLEAALSAAADLPSGLWVSLNVSPAFVLGSELRRILRRRTCPIVLEVTEHDAIEDYAAIRDAVFAFGPDVRMAVDDAGTGIANFGHIVELRPDFVKIDASLIRGINADLTRQALVVGLRHFASTTRCAVIAEGVETAEELATLQALDVEMAQGYLLGRPATVGTFSSEWVAEGTARGRRQRRISTAA
jgi:PAS domain S-box-containing protein